ncbi:MAG: hypothetical protein ACTSVT_03115 [Candidatus Thorarchaeota archaeon]
MTSKVLPICVSSKENRRNPNVVQVQDDYCERWMDNSRDVRYEYQPPTEIQDGFRW